MKEDTIDEFVIKEDEYNEVVKVIKSKDTKSYDFLVKAGKKYKESIGRFVIKMIGAKSFPDDFRKTE